MATTVSMATVDLASALNRRNGDLSSSFLPNFLTTNHLTKSNVACMSKHEQVNF